MIIDSHTPQSESNNSNNKSPYNTYSNVDDTSLLLYNNRTYSTYLPNIIIGMATFYILILCIKLFLKQRRRYINRLYRKEKQRLREKWEDTLNQGNDTVYSDGDVDVGGDGDKSLFIECPKAAYTQKRSSYAHSAPPLTSDNSLQDNYSVTVAYSYPNNASFELTHPNPSDSTLINIKTIGGKSGVSEKDKITSKRSLFRHNYYWKMRKSKRLDLIWQWSVSMGYCRYEYGRRLDDKITELQDNQSIYYNKGENSLTTNDQNNKIGKDNKKENGLSYINLNKEIGSTISSLCKMVLNLFRIDPSILNKGCWEYKTSVFIFDVKNGYSTGFIRTKR